LRTVRQVQPLLGVYHFLLRTFEIQTKGKYAWLWRGKAVVVYCLPNPGCH